jgi:hypothetical protein
MIHFKPRFQWDLICYLYWMVVEPVLDTVPESEIYMF